MSWDNKVVWAEGMFLRTHHFQQFDRYVEKLVRGRVSGLRPYPWGLTELDINRDLLKNGMFAVNRAAGVLPDGTPFAIPEDVPHPQPIELADTVRNCEVFLTLPVRQPGGLETEIVDTEETVARYQAVDFEATDAVAGAETVAQIKVGALRLRYKLQIQERTGFLSLGLARIVEVRPDRETILDKNYMPTCLDIAVSGALSAFRTELQGLLHHRGEALAARLGQTGTKGVAEIADFLLLLAINRYEPVLAHLGYAGSVHPETLYSLAVSIAGELSTFTSNNRRPSDYPAYRHDDLQATFAPVMADLRNALTAVLEQNAIPIPLEERRLGIRIGRIPDRTLLTQAMFVLAVGAEVPPDRVRQQFPTLVKIGPVEQIRELVNSALPGIGVTAMPVAPRAIPYNAGMTYFQLDQSSRFWKQLQTSGALAIHLAGDFPGIQMECWAIREG